MTRVRQDSGYRADIDGLRAVAVGIVLLFHAFPRLLPGGFVGVDVFFVISGYLITGIVAREAREGRFSLQRFYARRARRILPPLFVAIAATLVAGALVLVPGELLSLARQAAAALLSVSNIHFWRESGYFAPQSDFQPLLHTWSLAVEEQFYLVWPWAVTGAVAWERRRPGAVRIVLSATIAVSLLLSVVGVMYKPSAAFFLLPARAWELALGGALSLSRWTVPSRFRVAAAWGGLGLIAASSLLLSGASPFPGLWAIPPCVGAALLMAAGSSAWQGRGLESAPVVTLGRWSYSLYLWHWPLLALARVLVGADLSWGLAAALLVASVVLAAASYRWVETPFRHGAASDGRVLWLAAAGTVAGLAVAFGIHATGGLAQRVAHAPEHLRALSVIEGGTPEQRHAAWTVLAVDPVAGRCHQLPEHEPHAPDARCVEGSATEPTVLLWGDSHAAHYHAAVVEALGVRSGTSPDVLVHATRSACPIGAGLQPVLEGAGPVARREFDADGRCGRWNALVWDWLSAHPSVHTVVVASRWSVRLVDSKGYPGDVEALVSRLRQSGRRVVVLGEAPEQELVPASCLLRRTLPLVADDLRCEGPHPTKSERVRRSRRTLDGIQARVAGLQLWDPVPAMCDRSSERCPGVDAQGTLLYWDTNHLSLEASRQLGTSLRQWWADHRADVR